MIYQQTLVWLMSSYWFSNSLTLKTPGYFLNAEISVKIALNNASMKKNMSVLSL